MESEEYVTKTEVKLGFSISPLVVNIVLGETIKTQLLELKHQN